MINRILASVLIVVSVFVFGAVFVRQLRVNQNGLTDQFVSEANVHPSVVAGTSVIRSDADTSMQIENEVNTFNIATLEKEAKQLEAQVAAW